MPNKERDLEYYRIKANEEDYLNLPVPVLRYIMALEQRIDKGQTLPIQNVVLSDLPDDFYIKFEERKVSECGGSVLGNIDAQYYYSKGFAATINLLASINH